MSLRQNALLFAVMTALVAIVGAWSGDPTLAGLWRLPLGLLLLGLAYEGWNATRAKLSLTIEPGQRGILGRTESLQLSLQHQLHRDAVVELAPDAPALVEVDPTVQVLVAPSGAPVHTHLRITPRRLGEHTWPAIRVRIAGPLGLAWWPTRLATDFSLRVMPELLRDDSRHLGAVSTGAKPRHTTGAGSEVLQLRDYRSGDPQQLIDWKATARSGRLVSRDFSEDQHLEIMIAIDAGRAGALRAGELDRFGHYANLAARFAEHAIGQDDRVGVVLFADRPLAALAPGRGTAAVMRIRHLLAASKLVQAESNPLNAALRIRSLVRHRSLVVLLTDLDDATVAGQLASAARLLLPKHLPLIAGLASPQAENMRYATAHSWVDPYEALAAQEYCARLERNVMALRALGAPAVLARPDQLERAVFDAYAGFRQRRRV
ncbi:MAG TPA: DUF58 domain-containing protein [Povalibacter sp.]|jgi:uncharacterized protein (DUF58 family)